MLVERLVALRRTHPVFRQKAFFRGQPVGDEGVKDLAWLGANGEELTDAEWFDPQQRTIAMYLDGGGIKSRGSRGERLVDDSFLFVLHAGAADSDVTLPGLPWATAYDVVIDTCAEDGAGGHAYTAGAVLPMAARSAVLLRVTR
jgi:glycogen operon protein